MEKDQEPKLEPEQEVEKEPELRQEVGQVRSRRLGGEWCGVGEGSITSV